MVKVEAATGFDAVTAAMKMKALSGVVAHPIRDPYGVAMKDAGRRIVMPPIWSSLSIQLGRADYCVAPIWTAACDGRSCPSLSRVSRRARSLLCQCSPQHHVRHNFQWPQPRP